MRSRILGLHLLSLAAGGLYVLRVNRHQWFYGDEWAFLGGVRRTLPWYDQLLEPHSEHWSAAPYVVYRFLEASFGIRSYWPYIGLAILLHLAVVHLVWRVMLQGGITPWVATVVVLPLIVLGAGAQNLLWAFQIGFLGSVALGLGALLLVNHAGRWQRRDWAGLALLVFALLWSGVSILVVAVSALTVLRRRGMKPAVALAVPPAVIYLVWTAAYPPQTNLEAPSITAFAGSVWPYVATGLSTAADSFVLNVPLVGSVLLLLLVCFLVRTAERSRTAEAAIYACAAGAFAEYLLSAYARFKLGTGQASESRYGYVGIVLLAPAVALAVDMMLDGRGLPLRVACVAVFVLLGVTNAHLLRVNATADEAREVSLRGLILSAAHIANDPSQRVAPDAKPEPRYSPDLTVADLRRYGRNGELPGDRPSLERQLTAGVYLQVGIAPGKPVANCPTPPVAQTTVIPARPDGERAVIYGTPGAVISVVLADPETGTGSEQRQFELPSEWSVLSVYRPGVDVNVVTPPNAHVCP